MAAVKSNSYHGEDRRLVSIEREVGNAVRKWVLVVIGAICINAGAFIWGAATLHTTVNVHTAALTSHESQIRQIQATQRTDVDARRDFELRDQRIAGLERSLDRLDQSLNTLAGLLNGVAVDVAVITGKKKDTGG